MRSTALVGRLRQPAHPHPHRAGPLDAERFTTNEPDDSMIEVAIRGPGSEVIPEEGGGRPMVTTYSAL